MSLSSRKILIRTCGLIIFLVLVWLGAVLIMPEICAEKARNITKNQPIVVSPPTEEELKEYPNLQLSQLSNYYHEELKCKIEARKWLFFWSKLS